MHLDPRTLGHVLAVAEQKHFARAARECYTTPPVISRSVKSVEDAVGARIFDRGPGRDVDITARGRHILAHLRRTMDALERLPHAGHGVDPGAPVLHIGLLGVGLGDVWDPVCSTWAQMWPGVRLTYTPIDAHNHDTAVLFGDVDLAVVQLTGQEEPELDTLVTSSWPRAVVVHASSDLADAEELTPDDVADEHWLNPDTTGLLARWMDDLPALEAPRDTLVSDPFHVPAAVTVTRRVAVHSMAPAGFLETRSARFVPLTGRPAQIGVAVRRDDHRPALRSLLKVIELLHELPPEERDPAPA